MLNLFFFFILNYESITCANYSRSPPLSGGEEDSSLVVRKKERKKERDRKKIKTLRRKKKGGSFHTRLQTFSHSPRSRFALFESELVVLGKLPPMRNTLDT